MINGKVGGKMVVLMSKEQTDRYYKVMNTLFEKNREGYGAGLGGKNKVFVSFSRGEERAVTFCGTGNSLETAFQSVKNIVMKNIKKSFPPVPRWIYMDFVCEEEKISKEALFRRLNLTKRNYFRGGLAFDDLYQTAFLEQEINAAVLLDNDKPPVSLNERNITSFLRKKGFLGKGQGFTQSNVDELIVFKVKSYFYDAEKDEYHDIYSDGQEKGRRKTVIDKGFWEESIRATGRYLNGTVNGDGSFVYGYFPCYGAVVPGYNIIRHCLSVMALIDLYAFWPDEGLKENIVKTFNYVLREAVKDIDEESAVIVDGPGGEVKLGALGLGILMILRHAELFAGDAYLGVAKKLAGGILKMFNEETGEFTHVLNYPGLSLKDMFRVVYYPGEACYGLMKLYEKVKDERYLRVTEKAFDFFIQNDYDKYFDHWLAYAAGELTKYAPEEKYFVFALKNAMNNIDFILERQTTWATLLEMLNASFHVFEKIKEQKREDLFRPYNMEKFYKALSVRMQRQLNGILYPEKAMFFAKPAQILYGTYIRHHSFRVRNDDVAHHLIGYCHFVREILPRVTGLNLFLQK